MNQKTPQEQVAQMFNTISPSYDRINRILSFGIDLYWRKVLVRHLPVGNQLRLLDLATGTCDQLLTLLRSGKVGYALGIDVAEEMLNIGRKKISKSPYGNDVDLKVASALEIPSENDSFDCATITFGIRNVQGNCLQEIRRVLISGGRVLILEFSLPHNKILRKLHLLYLRKILPIIGGWISGEKKAYSYLNQTIESFPYGKAFLTLMEKGGFVNIKAIPLHLELQPFILGKNHDSIQDTVCQWTALFSSICRQRIA